MSEQGAIKYDPETGSVAIRTCHPDGPSRMLGRPMAWLVATTNKGARFVDSETVAEWVDVEVGGS